MAVLDAPRLALSFLTIVPMRSPGSGFARAVACFPLVGALVGAGVAAIDLVASVVLPIAVVSVIDLALLAIVSGGLHLDGLADSADGLLGGGSRDQRLRIMRDSGVGAFGIAAIALVLLLEAAALVALPSPRRLGWLVAAGALSRWAMAITLWSLPGARPDGLAATFATGLRARHAVVATLIAATVAVAALGTDAAPALAVGLLGVVSVGAFAKTRIGGVTGDVCGAIGEVVFAGQLVLASALARSVA